MLGDDHASTQHVAIFDMLRCDRLVVMTFDQIYAALKLLFARSKQSGSNDQGGKRYLSDFARLLRTQYFLVRQII